MNTTIGEREIRTQRRVVTFFQDALGYNYLGNWHHRPNNSNVETELLTDWLKRQGHNDQIISRTLFQLNRAATLAGESDALQREPRGLRSITLRRQGAAECW